MPLVLVVALFMLVFMVAMLVIIPFIMVFMFVFVPFMFIIIPSPLVFESLELVATVGEEAVVVFAFPAFCRLQPHNVNIARRIPALLRRYLVFIDPFVVLPASSNAWVWRNVRGNALFCKVTGF